MIEHTPHFSKQLKYKGRRDMTTIRVKIGTNGRLVVPISLRKEIGLTDGKSVLLETIKGELRIRPMKNVVLQAQ